MNRKSFLKICLAALAGLLFAKMPRWFAPGENKTTGLKEARFYRSSDRLAG